MIRSSLMLAAALSATPAFAQTAQTTANADIVSVPAATEQQAQIIPQAEPATVQQGPQWLAEVTSGYAKRDAGPSGLFAATALNRRFGRMYGRAALTVYRSTIEQIDTALPSTYLVGSVGTGGNFNNWVFDVWASWGWQHYGQIQTSQGPRRSNSTGSPYVSFGFDAGKILPLGKGFYLTPTVGGTYAHDRLLRPSPNVDIWPDYESREIAWTGMASLRLDKAFGHTRQHYVGVGASWRVTNNGLSVLVVPPMNSADQTFSTRHYADGWGELTGNAGFRLTPSLRLELTATRSMKALAGNATTASGGFRLAF
jgi:hypothetical protein